LTPARHSAYRPGMDRRRYLLTSVAGDIPRGRGQNGYFLASGTLTF
jgi:hypothetical protein